MSTENVVPQKPIVAAVLIATLAAVLGLSACGSYEEPQGTAEIVGTAGEVVTAPDVPTGDVVIDVGETVEFAAEGARSSRGHVLERYGG